MKATSERVMQWTVGSALGFIALTALVRPAGLVGAAAGAAVAVCSTLLLVHLTRAMLKRGGAGRAGLALMLMAKSAVVLVATAAIHFFARVDVVGFALGVSALVLGVLGGASHAFLAEGTESPKPPAGAPSDA